MTAPKHTRTLAVAALAVAALLAIPRSAPARTCDTQGPAGTGYADGVNCRTVALDGIDRRYVVHIPQDLPATRPVLRFGMIAGMGHKYPDRLVPEFWRFFRGHSLGTGPSMTRR